MSCSCGYFHTVCLSDDGVVYTFGRNDKGQLGLGHITDVNVPSPIQQIPKIKQISCGASFTVCVDYQGSMWSFGQNNDGQLGTGTSYSEPRPVKIQNIPLVESVSCGACHVLIISAIDKTLWSVGRNSHGQLCTGNNINEVIPRPTGFSNIVKIAAGGNHSLFQNNLGKIYGCGNNKYGQLGKGAFNETQIHATLVALQPPDIIQFCCGSMHTLFLDAKGRVYSVGYNYYGMLGLGHTRHQGDLKQIGNIPAIKYISTIYHSSYLIDVEGNVWSFGYNYYGQLGLGDNKNRLVPTKIPSLKDVRQISNGFCGQHFLAQNSENKIFVVGNNSEGQIAVENLSAITTPVEMKYVSANRLPIWGMNENANNEQEKNNKSNSPLNQWDSIRSESTLNWNEADIVKIEKLYSRIKEMKADNKNNYKIKQEFPRNSFNNWAEVQKFLDEKLQQMNSKLNQNLNENEKTREDVKILENELFDIDNKIRQLQQRKHEIEESLSSKKIEFDGDNFQNHQQTLKEMYYDVSIFCKNENEMNNEIQQLYQLKEFESFDCKDIQKLLWKMDFTKYQQIFEDNNINGDFVSIVIGDINLWNKIGIEMRDCYYLSYYFELMQAPGYYQTLAPDYEENCCVCYHNTPETTIYLLQEYDIPIANDVILENNYCAPILTFPTAVSDLNINILSDNGRRILGELTKWRNMHKLHVASMQEKES